MSSLLNHNLGLEKNALPNFNISDITKKGNEESKDSNVFYERKGNKNKYFMPLSS